MKLIPIFADEVSGEGLYSIQYPNESQNELKRIFNLWFNTQYVTEYIRANAEYLSDSYFGSLSHDDIINKVLDEADELNKLLDEYTDRAFCKNDKNLAMLFQALTDTEYKPTTHLKTKAKIQSRQKLRLLRIYAIKLDEYTFVITSGAIKLTATMHGHPDTIKEKRKLAMVVSYLNEQNIIIPGDIIDNYE